MTTLVKLFIGGYNNANFGGRTLYGDFVVPEASVSRAVNEAGSFDFSIPVALLRGQSLKLNGQWFKNTSTQNVYSADLYQDGELLIQGNANSLSLNYADDEPVFKFSCNGELADLTRYIAREDAYYQDEYVLYILSKLLTPQFGGSLLSLWAVGELFSLEDMLVKTTIDLRSESRLFSQLTALFNAVPNVFFRYGGYVPSDISPFSNHYTLDIGVFNEEIHPPISAESVIEMSQEVKYSGILRLMQSYGGEIELAGVKRRINLQDALAYDPSLASSGGFILNSSGLQNNSISFGFGEEVIQYFDEIVPAVKTNPSATEINQAGYALYLKTKNELLKKSTFQVNWQASVKELPDGFKVGDKIFLRGAARQVFYDQHSGKSLYVDLGTIAQWYRVNGYTLKIKNDNLTYSLDLTTDIRLQDKNDPILDLYDSISQPPKTSDSVYVSPGWVYKVLSVTIPPGIEGDAFNGTPGNYYPAAIYTIPLDAYPVGTTTAFLVKAPFSYTDNVTISVSANTAAAIPATGIPVVVSLNENWTIDDSVTINALVVYKP